MPVQVKITLGLDDRANVQGASSGSRSEKATVMTCCQANLIVSRLGKLIAELRELPWVHVEVDSPSADDLDRELDGLQTALMHARARFKASTEEIDELQARIDGARAINTWVRRADETAGHSGEHTVCSA